MINEQIQTVAGEIPPELGTPEMMPITTGLGEIYQYVLKVEPGYEDKYDAMELRTIQDWIVKRQLSGIPGIVEINSFGGYLKQYEVAVDPDALYSLNITIGEVFSALSKNNQNTGGSYIEKVNRAYYIRSEGMIKDVKDIEQIVIINRGGIPVHVGDIGKVRFGAPKRFGAMTKDGEGECVGGIAMMLKGANANVVTGELEKRVAKVQKMLPEGVTVEPYLNRSELVNRNISTVIKNLIEGAIIVFLVLIIFLGNVRAGLIVASVIPLAMLFGFIMMRIFGVSANLMSLGAIDFGIVVDGSIVILEGILAHIYGKNMMGRTFTKEEMDAEVEKGAGNVVRSATFAVLIILIVFFPILTLTGIEGKYFTPMAKTLVFCIIGALLLSLTYVPMMASLFLKKTVSVKPTLADRFFSGLNIYYHKTLNFCLKHIWGTIATSFIALIASLFLFTRLGAEFIPTLDEGDFAMQMTLPAGSSLSKSIQVSLEAEKILKEKFPEIKHVVAKIGTAEVPTDPMAVEDADIMIVMKPFSEWTSAGSRAEMVEKMKAALEGIEDVEFNFSQPIQLRFNELMTGAKADIAIKLYGEDMEELYNKAKEAAKYVEQVPGASDVLVEQAMGLPQLLVNYDRAKIARYGIDIEELNTIIRTAYAGETAGVVFENERRFDLVVRLDNEKVKDLNINRLFVRTAEGIRIPLSEVAEISFQNGPLQINRDATKRRVVIGVKNGILMINHFNDLRKKNEYTMCTGSIIRHGCSHLLRPVFLTGLVASLGFVPMAIATSAGAEVQRPLATVVIGGLIVSTVLTLIIIPVFHKLVNNISHSIMRKKNSRKTSGTRRAIAMTAIILSFAISANAQNGEAKRVSMEEAIEIALQNHPRLKVATAEIEKSRATRGEIWDGGSTSFSYAWGQLNGEFNKDNEMSIEQSLGSFLTPFYKNSLVKSQVSTEEYYRNMVKKEIIAEVKRAWTYYQYANSIYSLYKHQDEIAGKLKQSGDLRYSQGDIDLTEKNMISAMAANMRTMLLHWQEEVSLAKKRLTWVCYSDIQILPSDDSLAIFQCSDTDLLPSADHLNYFLGKVDEQKKLLQIERSKFFPEFLFGYTRQKIAPLKNLNSWMVGVSFPILFFPQKSRSKQAKISLKIAEWEADNNKTMLNNKVEELKGRLRQQKESLQYFTEAALNEAESLQNSAVSRYGANEIDITEFVQSINSARDIKKSYIETVYNYNVSVLELELYTDK